MKAIPLIALLCGSLCASAQVKNFSISAALSHPVINDVITESQINTVPVATTGYYSMTTSAKIRETYDGKTGFEIGTSFHAFNFRETVY